MLALSIFLTGCNYGSRGPGPDEDASEYWSNKIAELHMHEYGEEDHDDDYEEEPPEVCSLRRC